MPGRDDILWFKQQFQARIEPALAGTPLTVDLIVALACQETGTIWPVLRHRVPHADAVAALCAGDTLDGDRGRRAFPVNKAELLAHADGAAMFAIARQALVDVAQHIPAYAGAAGRAHKFCRGFGVFQRDLQFFRTDPHYFLDQRYRDFDASLAHCVGELQRALVRLQLADRAALTDLELCAAAIAYNTGRFKPALGLNQGFFDGQRHYGQAVFDFLRLSRTVALPGRVAPLVPAEPGRAIVPPASAVTATGPFFVVDTREGMLRVRREPRISTPAQANVAGLLPDGHRVRAISGDAVKGFIEIETQLEGALLHGWVAVSFVKPAPAPAPAPPSGIEPQPAGAEASPEPAPPPPGGPAIPAVTLPRREGRIIRRSEDANAHSLSEAAQPGRTGRSAAELRDQLERIIDWLAVDKATHRRYKPRDGLTFCNIYAHDYCHLAGALLPRVWWTPAALVDLAQGRTVEPLIGRTVEEMRANDLFRWLRDFGAAFGWRRTGTLTRLQTAANQGAVALIAARRREDGRPGHLAMVVPESASHRARRDTAGDVTAPLQSQAGSTNFRRGTGRPSWWTGEPFAESAFWIHA